MIKSFGHKGLEVFFETGSKAGIQANHADRLRLQLSALDKAKKPEDMNAPNWRLTFKFDGENAILVDYMDYH
jgi:proteic killer suppression protein